MALTTITLNGSTVVAPSRIFAYADASPTVISVINGSPILQRSANSDATGEKGAIRKLEWDGMLSSSSLYTHTITTLKALEGNSITINAGTLANSVYSSNTSILIHKVTVEPIQHGPSKDLWRVEITYTHV